MNIKVFKFNEPTKEKIEKEINKWLSENRTIKLMDIKQSMAITSSVHEGVCLITIWYI